MLDWLSLFGGTPESSVADMLLLRWSKIEWPPIGGAAFHWSIGAFTDWDVVENFGADSAKNPGETLVNFDLVGSHTLASLIQRLLSLVQ